MPRIRVSVVIPTLNSAETLEKCLASIKNNNGQYEKEIIVVDAGSSDETLDIAKVYADKVLTGVPNRINRNKGVECAAGDIICFTDSDCIVPENWLDGLVNGLLRLNDRDKKVVGVGGGNVPLLENHSSVELVISKVIRSPLVSFGARNIAIYQDEREVSHNPPLNSALFKRTIEEVGGFKEEPGYPEDQDLDAKIIGKGYKLYYLPDLPVYHKHKTSFEKFARQMQDFGEKRVRVNREHKHIRRFYHYGPLFLCLMLYSPFFFFPLAMALVNAGYVSFQERSLRFFIPVTFLSLVFYRSYGLGEIKAIKGTKK
jgi:glycosyltransferase involved in cell wall biosynthesis